MTTTSTNSYSRQETLHNVCSQSSGHSTLNGDSTGSRLPPRTRPVIALPPSKLEPVLDVDSSSAVYEDAYCETSENRVFKNPSLNGTNQPETLKKCDHIHDALNTTRSHEIPGNRPPMWRQRVQGHDANPHCHSCRKGSGDNLHQSKDRSKSSVARHNSDATSDSRLLPSKPSFRSGRHHRSESHGAGHSRSSRHVYNSLDSGTTGSSRPYDSKYTNSTGYNGYEDSQYSEYPDASQMNPDDPFYPPGGSFQPYQAKYEPGCYKSSSLSGCPRPKHPPSPPVRDEPLKPEFSSEFNPEESRIRGDEKTYHRAEDSFFNQRSSSMQNISQCEEPEKSGIRRRLARSASAHRKHDSNDRRAPSRMNSSLQGSQQCSSTSSFSIDNTGSYLADYPKIRGRPDSRRPNGTELTNSLYYDSNHNMSKSKQDLTSHCQTSKCSSSGSTSATHGKHRTRNHNHSHSSDTRSRTKDTELAVHSSTRSQVKRLHNCRLFIYLKGISFGMTICVRCQRSISNTS